jgi:hypothetical protein
LIPKEIKINFILRQLSIIVKPFGRASFQDPGALKGFELQLRLKLNITVTIRKQI